MNARLFSLGAFALVCALLTADASAVLEIYLIDPSQSSLAISGNLTGDFSTQQSGGSMVTSYSGSIAADRAGNTIRFTGGSAVDAAVKGNFEPDNDGFPGTDPADYGRRTSSGGGPFGTTAYEAIRDLMFDLRDDTSGVGAAIAGDSTFSGAAFYLHLLSGESDSMFGLGGAPDLNLAGKETGNGNGNGLSSVTVVGSTEILTLKFSTGPIGYSINTSGDSNLTFTGTIVATRELPEPAAGIALAASAMMLLSRRRTAR